ncbi:MAG: lamin tail domain-containing protein, partial [Bacteroidota bacterium]
DGSLWTALKAASTDYSQWRQLTDPQSFMDFMLCFMWGQHENEYKAAGKGGSEPGFLFRVNDPDGGFSIYGGNVSLDRTDPNGTGGLNARGPGHMFQNLYNEADPDFLLDFADRAHCHCSHGGALSPSATLDRLNDLVEEINVSMVAEAARWGGKGKDPSTWMQEIDQIRTNYLPYKADTLIKQLKNRNLYPSLNAVVFNQHGGKIQSGFQLIMTNPNANGQIYYTLDGSDPRQSGGHISPSANVYNAPLSLTNPTTTVMARVLHNGIWSAACPIRFYREQDFAGLIINEIHYNPGQHCRAEFIELKNTSNTDLYLTDLHFSKGIGYIFPAESILPADSFWVIAAQADTFQLDHGFYPDGEYLGSLANGGERIRLKDPFGETIDEVNFDDSFPWDSLADGHGYSLELVRADLDNDLADNWLHAQSMCGTPGQENDRFCPLPMEQLVFSEVMYNYDFQLKGLDAGDWVELYNHGQQIADLSSWRLEDADSSYVLPNGTQLLPGQYLVISADSAAVHHIHPQVSQLLSAPGLGLSGKGERLILRKADACPVIGFEYDNNAPWPEAPDGEGVSLMRKSPDRPAELASSWRASGNLAGTPGAANEILCQEVLTHPLVINEIQYKSGNASGDWIEIFHSGNENLDLSAWEFHDEKNFYRLPSGTTIGPQGFLVIAQDPLAFQAVYPGINVIGGWDFGLSGNGEWLALLTDEHCWVDGLSYNDSPPWPEEADGDGPSLSLIHPSLDNALAASWQPSTKGNAPTGTPGAPNQIPDPCAGLSFAKPGINEISYRSAEGQDAGNWLEVYNPSQLPQDLSSWMLIDEDSVFSLPANTFIPANGFLIIAEDVNAFQLHYPTYNGPIAGSSQLNFNNGGERLLLYTAERCLIDSVDYRDEYPWPIPSDQAAMHIALIDSSLDNGYGFHWQNVTSLPSPGQPNIVSCQAGLIGLQPSLWLRADLPGNGGPIAQWTDRSGNGHHLLQSNPGSQPIFLPNQLNGNGLLSFDGQTQWGHLASISPLMSDSAQLFFLLQNGTNQASANFLHNAPQSLSVGFDSLGKLLYPNSQAVSNQSFSDQPMIAAISHIPAQEVDARINGHSFPKLDLLEALPMADSSFIGKAETSFVDTVIWLEAECGKMGSKFQIKNDPDAANGQYIEVLTGNNDYNAPGDTSKHIVYSFSVSKAGTYRFYGRVRANNGGNDSFWFRVNQGSWNQWNGIEISNTFIWDQIHNAQNGGQAVLVYLAAGEHSLTIASREDGTRLDRILISLHNASPQDLGGNAFNCNASPGSAFWAGKIGEVLMFEGELSGQEKRGVESYLAIKYGLSVKDHHLLDQKAYTHHQGGIGRDDRMCLWQTSSQNIDTAAILRISATSNLSQGSLIVWASDGGSVQSQDAQEGVPSPFLRRTDRTWFINAYGPPIVVNLQFDLGQQGWDENDPYHWQILGGQNDDFTEAQPLEADSVRMQNGLLTFYGLQFTAPGFITLGYRDYLRFSVNMLLSGPYEQSSGLMRDDLRTQNVLPQTDPYLGRSIGKADVFQKNGPDAIVDWVLIRLRAQADSSMVVAEQSALLTRNGQLISSNGVGELLFPVAPGPYFVSIHHRNHLGAMSKHSLQLTETNSLLDFRSLETHGINAQRNVGGGLYALWSGDANGDGRILYQGLANDLNELFLSVLTDPLNTGFARNFIKSMSYERADINLFVVACKSCCACRQNCQKPS